jgi:tetratricopeptide (TPR) repeat protein
MRNGSVILAAATLSAALAGPAWGIDIGQGPSQTFMTNLPSYGINKTLGGGYSTVDRFLGGAGRGAGDVSLYSFGIERNLMLETYRAFTFSDMAVGPGLGPLVDLRVRTIDALHFDKRARFAKLRETTLALAERIRQTDEASLSQVSLSFRQFMFPMPLQDAPGLGYGFFSRLDLVGAGSTKSEALVKPFTEEVQQSLGDKRFLDATQALLFNQPLPQGMQIDQFYDPQLAAMANFLFNNGRYAAAAQAWQVLIDRDPASPTASRGLALCLLATGQAKKAAAEIRRSLALAEGWPDKVSIVGSNLQDVFPSSRDLVGMRDELATQLAKQPDDADLNLVMGFVDLFHGQRPSAEERLAKAAATDPAALHLLALLKGGAVADSINRPAQSALKRAAEELTGLEEPAMTPEARAKLVVALKAGGGYEDLMRVGDFRFFMGDFTQAGEAYRAAHKARPQDAFALFALVHSCFANGEYRQAVRYMEDALAREPNWGLYEFRLQEFYGDRDEYRRHLRDLQRQVEIRPRLVESKFLLAYIYYFSGRYADAADLLAEILRLDPNFQKADYFLRLARLQG